MGTIGPQRPPPERAWTGHPRMQGGYDCPGHPADRKGLWSLTFTRNWRLVFRYDEHMNIASDIDLIDYH